MKFFVSLWEILPTKNKKIYYISFLMCICLEANKKKYLAYTSQSFYWTAAFPIKQKAYLLSGKQNLIYQTKLCYYAEYLLPTYRQTRVLMNWELLKKLVLHWRLSASSWLHLSFAFAFAFATTNSISTLRVNTREMKIIAKLNSTEFVEVITPA